ncbi:MAG TPA: hypothetical protein VJB06_00265, partial [archaeon]|nr:hypothetical protein [archaeon]
KDMATQMVKSEYSGLFEQAVKLGLVDPNLVFRALTSMISELKAEGIETENLTDETLLEIFRESPKSVSKEGLYEALKQAAKTGEIQKIGGLSEQELTRIIQKVISRNKDALQKQNPEQILMGEVMKEAKGKADGKKIMEILRKELEKGRK